MNWKELKELLALTVITFIVGCLGKLSIDKLIVNSSDNKFLQITGQVNNPINPESLNNFFIENKTVLEPIKVVGGTTTVQYQ